MHDELHRRAETSLRDSIPMHWRPVTLLHIVDNTRHHTSCCVVWLNIMQFVVQKLYGWYKMQMRGDLAHIRRSSAIHPSTIKTSPYNVRCTDWKGQRWRCGKYFHGGDVLEEGWIDIQSSFWITPVSLLDGNGEQCHRLLVCFTLWLHQYKFPRHGSGLTTCSGSFGWVSVHGMVYSILLASCARECDPGFSIW